MGPKALVDLKAARASSGAADGIVFGHVSLHRQKIGQRLHTGFLL